MDIRNIGLSDTEWINLTQYRVQCTAVVNTLMNLRIP
jgi:hypothetical protein